MKGEKKMKSFQLLLEVATILHGPKGCPWDREQTLESLRPYILEETHEVLEAIDSKDYVQITEELGDLLYTIIFCSKIAEKENQFSLDEVLDCIREKLIRRHPHVFGEDVAHCVEDVYRHWNRIKKEENKHKGRESLVDGIPITLPALFRAQKLLKRIEKTPAPKQEKTPLNRSEQLAQEILALVRTAINEDIDLECAVLEELKKEEESFRNWEKMQ